MSYEEEKAFLFRLASLDAINYMTELPETSNSRERIVEKLDKQLAAYQSRILRDN